MDGAASWSRPIVNAIKRFPLDKPWLNNLVTRPRGHLVNNASSLVNQSLVTKRCSTPLGFSPYKYIKTRLNIFFPGTNDLAYLSGEFTTKTF
jgi:hypothetical protein